MKYLFACCFAIFTFTTLFAQQKIDFDTTILVSNDKDLYDYRSITIDNENNTYVSGYFKGTININGVVLNTNSTSNYQYSKAIFIAKFDSFNNLLWAKKIAECDTFFSFSILADNSNNIYIPFDYRGKVFFENDSTESNGLGEIKLIKLNKNGNFIFTLDIGSYNGEGLAKHPIAIDNKNNFYLSGSFNYTWTNNYPNYKLGIGVDTLTANTMDMFIVKYDSMGNALWAKSYGGGGSDDIASIYYENNSLYIAGSMYAGGINTNDIGGINISFPINYISSARCYLAKLDANNGSGIWARRFGSTDVQTGGLGPTSLVVIKNKIYFTGHAFSNYQNLFLFEGGPTLTGTDQTDYFIACYDTLGNFKWNTISNSPGSEYLTQLTTDSVGNVYGVGKFNYTLKFSNDTLYSNGGDDVMVCSYDSNGVYRWAISGGGSGGESGSGIASNAQGKLYIVGGTTSSTCYMGNDTLYPSGGISTLYYASIDSIPKLTPLSVKDYTNLQPLNLSIIPNPSNYNVTFNIDASNVLGNQNTLTIRSIYGELIQTWNLHTSTIQYNTAYIPSGIYIATLQNNKQTNTFKFSIQH